MRPPRYQVVANRGRRSIRDAAVEQTYYRRIAHELCATLCALDGAHAALRESLEPAAGYSALDAAARTAAVLRYQVGELDALHRGFLRRTGSTVASLRDVADLAAAVCAPWCAVAGTRLRVAGSDATVVASRQDLVRLCVLSVLLLIEDLHAARVSLRLGATSGADRIVVAMRAHSGAPGLADRLVRILEGAADAVAHSAGSDCTWARLRACLVVRTMWALGGTLEVKRSDDGVLVARFVLAPATGAAASTRQRKRPFIPAQRAVAQCPD